MLCAQSTNLNVNVTEKLPHRNIQNDAGPQIWIPWPAKMTHKTDHHRSQSEGPRACLHFSLLASGQDTTWRGRGLCWGRLAFGGPQRTVPSPPPAHPHSALREAVLPRFVSLATPCFSKLFTQRILRGYFGASSVPGTGVPMRRGRVLISPRSSGRQDTPLAEPWESFCLLPTLPRGDNWHHSVPRRRGIRSPEKHGARRCHTMGRWREHPHPPCILRRGP